MATPTVAQVIASANTARQHLAMLERELQEGIDEIDFNAFKEGRSLTPAEIKQRRELRATQAEIRDEFKVLAFVTLQRLDESDEVAQLLHQLEVINAGLEDDLERLKKIEKYATIAAKVADSLAKTAGRLAAIL
jgi:hypothetical protein